MDCCVGISLFVSWLVLCSVSWIAVSVTLCPSCTPFWCCLVLQIRASCLLPTQDVADYHWSRSMFSLSLSVTRGSPAVCFPVLQYQTSSHSWQRVLLDILVGFSLSLGENCHLLVLMDAVTQYCELINFPGMSVWCVAKTFQENILDRHCTPKVLVTDSWGE